MKEGAETTEKPKKSETKTKKAETKTLLNDTESTFDSVIFECSKENELGQKPNLKVVSFNVDGIRAWLKKGGLSYIEREQPDILCLQETKCSKDKLPGEITDVEGYHSYWCDSEKDGYAGVGLLSKVKPLQVKYGIGNDEHDSEGRCITAEYNSFFLITVYVPNAGRGLVTLPKRLEWNELFKTFVKELDAKKPVIVCGDMNVSHKEIDLANPKTNKKNAGFTQEERDGMTDFLGEEYVDSFRHFYPEETGAYSFWTYMGKARSKNVGWRLDYFLISTRFMSSVCDSIIRPQILGSDHCPIVLFLNTSM